MKLLLAQNASYYPALGGANKSNRDLLEKLSQRGHQCRVVSTVLINDASEHTWDSLEDIGDLTVNSETVNFFCKGVNVHAVKVRAIMDTTKLKEHFIKEIKEFDPTWILISTEDAGHVLLETAVNTAANRVIYLARTTIWLPFGPDCFLESSLKTELLRKIAGIIVVGEYLKDYLWKWAKLKSEVLPISLFGESPFPDFGNFKQGYVTMVNPCGYKGISIFIDLANLFPEIQFAAIPTWGTTSDDLRALKELGNINILEPVADMDQIYCKTRIMLVPSLWAEAKSRTIVEAMARGIPVLASDVGGNPEAKLGVEYVLPVNPIRGYRLICDERSLPVSQIPKQDIKPWAKALRRLLTDESHYREISARSRKAALDYIENRGGSERVEDYLLNLKVGNNVISNTGSDQSRVTKITDQLTPAQKALLALRLKQRKKLGDD